MRLIQCWLSVGAAAALALAVGPAIAQPETEPPEGDATESEAAEEPADLAESSTSPEESPSATPPAPRATTPVPAAPDAAPPSDYYTEPPAAGGEPDRAPRASSAPPAVYEPLPPGAGPIYEPPPPPEPEHVAPKNAVWVGARGGWWVPFGSAWGRCTLYYSDGYCAEGVSIAMRDFVSSGPMLELDAGARISRLYNVYVAWERAELGGGNTDLSVTMPDDTEVIVPPSERARTNFYGLGVRFSSDADRVGFLADLLIGIRDMSVEWGTNDAGIERLTMSQAPLEFRFGLGADIRLHPLFALSPLVTVGSGRFGNLEWEFDDGTKQDAMDSGDLFAAHGWFTVQLGAHFDFFGQ